MPAFWSLLDPQQLDQYPHFRVVVSTSDSEYSLISQPGFNNLGWHWCCVLQWYVVFSTLIHHDFQHSTSFGGAFPGFARSLSLETLIYIYLCHKVLQHPFDKVLHQSNPVASTPFPLNPQEDANEPMLVLEAGLRTDSSVGYPSYQVQWMKSQDCRRNPKNQQHWNWFAMVWPEMGYDKGT